MRSAHLDEASVSWRLKDVLAALEQLEADLSNSLSLRESGTLGDSSFTIERVRGRGYFVTLLERGDDVETELLNPGGESEYSEVVLGGLATRMPSEVVVSLEAAKAALIEYLRSGERSRELQWRQMQQGY